MKKFLLRIFASIATAIGVSSCEKVNESIGIADDNPIEEATELLIQEDIGIKIDFTPHSEEKHESS